MRMSRELYPNVLALKANKPLMDLIARLSAAKLDKELYKKQLRVIIKYYFDFVEPNDNYKIAAINNSITLLFQHSKVDDSIVATIDKILDRMFNTTESNFEDLMNRVIRNLETKRKLPLPKVDSTPKLETRPPVPKGFPRPPHYTESQSHIIKIIGDINISNQFSLEFAKKIRPMQNNPKKIEQAYHQAAKQLGIDKVIKAVEKEFANVATDDLTKISTGLGFINVVKEQLKQKIDQLSKEGQHSGFMALRADTAIATINHAMKKLDEIEEANTQILHDMKSRTESRHSRG